MPANLREKPPSAIFKREVSTFRNTGSLKVESSRI